MTTAARLHPVWQGAAALLLVSAAAAAPVQLRTVSSLTKEATGQTVESVTNEAEIDACKEFLPSNDQLNRYFILAQTPVEGFILHDYYSSCYAAGEITFTDGLSGRWVLYSSGVAWLVTPEGKDIQFFYPDNDWTDPFEWNYDPAG